ncbi:MAG: TRAP transporter TatT component family protein [Desulfobacterales bacterium]|nr:TRAP transporter TatT component family protein [Desulfobacterales bacterium]
MFIQLKSFILATAFIFLTLFTGGCASSITRMTVDGMKPLMEKMRVASTSNQDVEIVRDAMPAFLVQMDGFIEVSPENRFLLANAAESYMGYAFLFVEDTDRDRAKALYYKSREYALRNLKLNKIFAQALEQDDIEVFKQALKTIHKRDIAPLYFAANAWLQWIRLDHAENPNALNDLPKVEAITDRVLELDDTFYYGGIHAVLGAWYVSRPQMFGGQPDLAKFQFEEAFEISESKFLLWQYLYARYYAVEIKDRKLFVDTLNQVISAPDDLLPQEAFVNAAVKLKAGELLKRADDYFVIAGQATGSVK